MNRHWVRGFGMLAVFTMIGVTPMSNAAAQVEVPDQVLAWNLHAYNELIVGKGQAPPVAVLHLAMVHGAIYDAVNAIDGAFQPYLGAPGAESSYSKDAAAAAAGYQVLLNSSRTGRRSSRSITRRRSRRYPTGPPRTAG